MTNESFRPNWASPPGKTIVAILESKGVSLDSFRQSIGLAEADTTHLLVGSLEITPAIAKQLAGSLGSTPRFWLERDRQFRSSVEMGKASSPELAQWFETFPTRVMQQMGWIPKGSAATDAHSELLDFFGVSSVKEWREKYLSRLVRTQFRTSTAYENNAAATTAWLRRGELEAESQTCGRWDREGFGRSLAGLKPLTLEKSPKTFMPRLIDSCARYGVAVVVVRCPTGCAASGATCMLSKDRALLLLSGRFLSDDQFWFSFFHEAGHLVLHDDESFVEDAEVSSRQKEDEANAFAAGILLQPEREPSLSRLEVNKFAISRFARKCGISPGIVVGQLQHRGLASPASYNAYKVRYRAGDFIL